MDVVGNEEENTGQLQAGSIRGESHAAIGEIMNGQKMRRRKGRGRKNVVGSNPSTSVGGFSCFAFFFNKIKKG